MQIIRNYEYFDYWQQKAIQIAKGEGRLTESDILAIRDGLDFGSMNPGFFPPSNLANKSLKSRKKAALQLTTQLWGVEAEAWLALEKGWVNEIRAQKGESRDDGKDEHDDIICTSLLTQIFSVSYLFYQLDFESELDSTECQNVRTRALRGLNDLLENAVDKGFDRANTVSQKENDKPISFYGYLAQRGVVVGAPGLYLPNPEKTLFQLITLLHRQSIRPEVYIK